MAVQVAVWNNGNESVRPEHVLDTLSLSLDPATEILEARILKVVRDVSKFAVEREGWDRGVVPLSWKILEMGDGAIVQLIYVGEKTPTVRLNGAAEGQRRFIKSDFRTLPLSNAPRYVNLVIFILMIIALFFVVRMAIKFFSWIERALGKSIWQGKESRDLILAIIVAIVGVAGYIYTVIYSHVVAPPFDL